MTPSVKARPAPRPSTIVARRRRTLGALVALTLGAGAVGAVAAPAAQAAETRVQDSFTRTVSGGWGSGDTGATWSHSADLGRFAVSGGVGLVALTTDGQTQKASLPGAGASTSISVTLATDKTPTGTGLYVSVVGRRTEAGGYQGKVRWLPDGSVNASLVRLDRAWQETALTREVPVPGVRGDAGRPVRVTVEATGANPTTIRLRVWQAGTAEPAGWTATATDATAGWQTPGGVGVDSYLSRASVPLTVRVDDVTAVFGAGAVVSPSPAPVTPAPTPTAPAPTSAPSPAPTATPSQPTATTPAAPSAPTTSAPPTAAPSADPSPSPGPGVDEPRPRATATAGSVPVGSARYPVPATAFYVAPSGLDSNPGTMTAPLATVGRAVSKAPSGATIVLRQGVYHESVTIPATKTLTLQNYPGEVVWFDGSSRVTAWAADSGAWRLDGWTSEFDASPTYTKGAPDGTAPGWGFVNAAYPMAAHPDMVFIDGVGQRQVASRDQVTPGSFYVDYATDRLYLGSDPTGHQVRGSDLARALLIQGPNSVVRGIGFHRYAVSVPTKGTVVSSARGVTIENVLITDSATQGLFVGGRGLGENNVIRHVTADRNGMLGIESSYADGLLIDGVRATGNNTERFNNAPVSGGFKMGRARNITVKDSVFSDNLSTGLWFDESVYNATVTGNDVQRNTGNGIAYEISAEALIADNLITGNAATGLKVNNASEIDVWNNTIVGNSGRPVWFVQDSRVASDLSAPGHDPRQTLPDPTVTWLLGPLTIKNNIIGGATSANCILCVEDGSLLRTPAQIGITSDGNVLYRTAATAPTWLSTWPRGARTATVSTTLAAHRLATGQDTHSLEFTGAAPVDATYRPTPALTAQQGTVAQPLSAAAARSTGYPAGERHLGAWLN